MAEERSLVARRIEEIRLTKRLSRQQLADRLNTLPRTPRRRAPVTRLQVWRIETGVTEVSADTAAEFAEALEVSVASLYRESRAAS